MATAMAEPELKQQTPLPPRQGPLLDDNHGVRLESGHYLVGEDDAVLEKPVVYYNPAAPDLKFRLVPGQYPLPHFDQGKFVCRTKRQEQIVRRILGGNADRWRGDSADQDEDIVSRYGSTVFATRNIKAHLDFLKITGQSGI